MQGKMLLSNFFYNKKGNIQRNTYVWNMLAGIASAAESVIFSLIVTRLVGLADAGIITIGFAIGNLMVTIGKFGVRTFQVTDITQKYEFSSYYYARLVTIVLMIAVSSIYIIYCYVNKGYTIYKVLVVGLMCFKFCIEAYEDVFAGECQRLGRLDASSRIFVVRSIGFVGAFTLVLILSKHVVTALLIGLLYEIIMEIEAIKITILEMKIYIQFPKIEHIKEIILNCLPLFLSAFFFFYITNAPKYAIDTVMDDEVQACYSFIAFPVFAIELLNNFIYQPSLVDLANDWISRKYYQVKKRIYRQLCIVFGLTVCALAVGYYWGIPVLSFVFSTNLEVYKKEMLVLLLGGGLLAVIGYLSTILITMRKSIVMIYGYTVVFVISLFAYAVVIEQYGVWGGVVLYCLLCFSFALYEYIIIAIQFRKCIAEMVEHDYKVGKKEEEMQE